MRDIADAAGVTLSLLNYYYKNKEGLFTAVIQLMINTYLQELENSFQSAVSKEERIEALIRYFKELVSNRPGLLRLFIDFTAQALWIPAFREQVDSLFNSLAELIEKKLLVDIEVKEGLHSSKGIARFILSSLYGVSVQMLFDPGKTDILETFNLVENLLAEKGRVFNVKSI
jgi:AcrR family transcriptional regulator